MSMKFAGYFQIPLLSASRDFSIKTQTKPHGLWLNPAGPNAANGDKTIDIVVISASM